MSPDLVAAIAAFLSGGAAILSAGWSLRRMQRHGEAECEKRLAAFREGLAWKPPDE